MNKLCKCGSGKYTKDESPCDKCRTLPYCPKCNISPNVYPMAQYTYVGCGQCGLENNKLYDVYGDAINAWIKKVRHYNTKKKPASEN